MFKLSQIVIPLLWALVLILGMDYLSSKTSPQIAATASNVVVLNA